MTASVCEVPSDMQVDAAGFAALCTEFGHVMCERTARSRLNRWRALGERGVTVVDSAGRRGSKVVLTAEGFERYLNGELP